MKTVNESERNERPAREKGWSVKKSDLSSYGLLLIGLLFFAASGIRWNIPVAAWLWPVFILAFLRKSNRKSSPVLTLVAFVLLGVVKAYGALDAGPVVDHLMGAVLGGIYFLPLWADRLLGGSLKGIPRTLVFPLACVVLELLQSLTPMGVISMWAASQADNKPLMQITSIFGTCGVVFILTWLAPVVCEVAAALRENGLGKASLPLKRLLLSYGALLISVLSFGGLRLALAPVDTPTVKAALTTGLYVGVSADEYYLYEVNEERDLRSIEGSAQTAAGGEADILVFCEQAFLVPGEREEAFVASVGAIAKQYSMPMLVGMDVTNGEDGPRINKLVYINGQGEKTFSYLKSKLIPIVEDDSVRGDGIIPCCTLQTHSGEEVNMSAVICFDSDHAAYIRNALPRETDILFVPTWDWNAIRAYHTKWVEYRAAENGVSLVRATYNGVSTATDSYGRVTMVTDTAGSGFEKVVFAQVPIHRRTTVYSLLGNVTDLLFVVAFLGLCCLSIVNRRKGRQG